MPNAPTKQSEPAPQSATYAPAGCRLAVYPMTDAYVSVILDALANPPRDDLTVVTDDVSTYVGGEPNRILAFVTQAIVAASRRTHHVVATLLLSRGCPGEEICQPEDGRTRERPIIRPLQPSGISVAAHFSLYPLGTPAYMDLIGSAVEAAKAAGVYVRSEHFTSRLEGDLAEVLFAIADNWARSAADHVVAHATLSIGSPTGRARP